MPKKDDIYCKFNQEMFRMLVSGKEVIIEQPDGSKWHFILEDMGWDQMEKEIRAAKLAHYGAADC